MKWRLKPSKRASKLGLKCLSEWSEGTKLNVMICNLRTVLKSPLLYTEATLEVARVFSDFYTPEQ